jgi:hypothetical protein
VSGPWDGGDPVLELVDRALRLPEGARRPFVLSSRCSAGTQAEALAILEAITSDPALVGADASSPAITLVGVSLGDFRPVRAIGCGAGGVVYEAQQRFPERTVAVKVLRPTADPVDTRARWREESMAIAALQHPCIAVVYAAGMEAPADLEPIPWIAMELVDGARTWTDVACSGASLRDMIRLGTGFADGLGAAHRLGMVHGDVKPSNLLVSSRGDPKVIDFGLARPAALHSGRYGTRGYMAPECLGGAPATSASDVWSFGTSLAEVLHGVHAPSRHPVWSIVRMATEQDPGRRYQDCAIAAQDLRAILEGGPVRALRGAPLQRLRRFGAHHARAIGIGMIAVTVTLASLVWAVSSNRISDALMLRDAQRILSMHGEFTDALDAASGGDRDIAAARVLKRGMDACSPMNQDAEVAFISAAGLLRLGRRQDACELSIHASLALREVGLDPSELAWIDLLAEACKALGSPGDASAIDRLRSSMVRLSSASRGSDLVLGAYVYAAVLQPSAEGFAELVPVMMGVPELDPSRSITGTAILMASASIPSCDWTDPWLADTALASVERWTEAPLDGYLAPIFADMATDAIRATMRLGDVARLDALSRVARLASARSGLEYRQIQAESWIAVSEIWHGLNDRAQETLDRMLLTPGGGSVPSDYWAFWLPARLGLALGAADPHRAVLRVADAIRQAPWITDAQPELSRGLVAWRNGDRIGCDEALRDWRSHPARRSDPDGRRSDASLCDGMLQILEAR